MTVRRPELGLFLIFLFSASFIHHPVEYDNTLSRFFLLSAVVDYGRLDIEAYKDQTIDISVAGDKTYSNKAIGAPLVAAPIYWALRRWTPIRHDAPLSPRARRICVFLTTTVPFALLGVVMYRVLLGMGAAPINAYLAVLAYGLGTIAWIHAAMFSGHQVAANFAFFSFACLHGRADGDRWKFLGAGCLAGLAALSDYTAIFLAILLAAYAMAVTSRWPTRAAFLAGVALCGVVLAAYNGRCFGGAFSFSYEHLGYGDFAAGARRGFMGVAAPVPESLMALMFSPARGIFFIMPVLLLSLPGFWLWFERVHAAEGAAPDRGAGLAPWVAGAAVVGYLLINAGFYGWHGGWTFGPRYLAPILPFLVLPLAFALDRPWFSALFLASFLQISAAQMVMPHTPEEIRNPIAECLYPLFRYGYRSDTWGSRLRMSELMSAVIFVSILAALVWRTRPAASPVALPDGSQAVLAVWRPIYPLALAGIIIGLFLTRSPATVDIHTYNSRLLASLAGATGSEALSAAALQEARRSPRGILP
ncbi:MAG: hypothetical protein A3G34_07410 [Candidatus Lindowbacteria bacterium RIFCSPLOWO2_12_FULL_62_27]|nr:MAG: hypothetical protein A3G34_07410 [Candidatus Lindowbacteria bacterium RIFCSPLOWO2_12_FULL_62_27]OGH61879.1 MAG: hypothetical protein A3I06_16800 [Candidatus Lindowbacteria bacterium RIFCSPLOWO2_02_FULL_62_12]